MMSSILVVILALGSVVAQCPPALKEPCSCSSTRYEAVSIVCDRGTSLGDVLNALSSPQKQIDSLVVSNTPIDQLPAYVFQGFRIKKLVLKNNGLRSIHSEAFAGTLEETLEEVDIRSNFIDNIPQQGLPKLKNLRALTLSDNVIDYVQENAFLSYLSRETLERLDLSANNMTRIHTTGLLGLENIVQLSLDKNLFQDIPSAALANIPSLEDLSMGVNQLRSVRTDSLPLHNLKSLSLEVNQIRTIPADVFHTVPGLTYLYLGNNLLTSIDPTMFYYISGLKVLSMGNNKDITAIHKESLQHLSELIRLELSDCSIAQIDGGSFKTTPKIQVIILARNQITRIPQDTFSELPHVVNIDLSGNSITHIEDFSFAQEPALKQLDLSSNRLENLPKNIFYQSFLHHGPTQTRSLLLHFNPWRCDADLTWLRKWLRDNGDIQISSLGAQSARCWSPTNLNGLDLRQTDPVQSKTENHQPPGSMRRLMKPAEQVFTPTRRGDWEEPAEARVESLRILFIVLGCVLSILLVCAALIAVIRYFARDQEAKENNSNFGSSSVSSGFGSSAYSNTGIMNPRAHRSATNHNVFMNRPRYWWF